MEVFKPGFFLPTLSVSEIVSLFLQKSFNVFTFDRVTVSRLKFRNFWKSLKMSRHSTRLSRITISVTWSASSAMAFCCETCSSTTMAFGFGSGTESSWSKKSAVSLMFLQLRRRLETSQTSSLQADRSLAGALEKRSSNDFWNKFNNVRFTMSMGLVSAYINIFEKRKKEILCMLFCIASFFGNSFRRILEFIP